MLQPCRAPSWGHGPLVLPPSHLGVASFQAGVVFPPSVTPQIYALCHTALQDQAVWFLLSARTAGAFFWGFFHVPCLQQFL